MHCVLGLVCVQRRVVSRWRCKVGKGLHVAVQSRAMKHLFRKDSPVRELPNFFLKSHDYRMYSRNVEFISQYPRIKTRGRITYQAIVTVLRFIAWNYCADIRMEVMKMTQHPEDWTIQVRWRVTGLPLHVLMLKFYKKDKTELYRTYDAYSTFYLGPDGLIHRHKIDKMMPTQPPFTKVKTLLAGALVALGMEEHRPALNLLFAQSTGKVGEKHC
ncbi:uncharacterized protein C6orf136 homolog isoform X2 [Scyliorhinus canicula]|uniref:uncharacterized protein C6orf136 homolog isoform X2 n=1 Tax=Scyliorhinus canicula TaxID=7830 RepID=UPI0018F58244|nr:uncharacterized protein C6orf136 homolog isoform X2 [Scyliorhinus canicula]